MKEDEIKEDCLMESGMDLGRYSYTEMTQIKDAMRRYNQALNKKCISNCKHENYTPL